MWRFSHQSLALISIVLVVASCSRGQLPTLPDVLFATVPDMPQEGPAFDPRYDSDTLCAPVAVSNSLAWLQGNNSDRDQIDLVNKLAHPHYMRTIPRIGTGPASLMRGVERYLAETGQLHQRLEYAGMRRVSEKYRAAKPLSLEWLHAGLTPRSAVWLNLGWYTRVLPGIYRRKGGHWVTLVGFSNGGLVFHDPGPWQDTPEPVQVIARRNRWLDIAGWQFAPLSLEVKDFPGREESHTVLDGAVILALEP